MTTLPATLRPWEESLADLDPRLAVALGPMLHVLDELIGRLDAPGGESGEPDGYDGTTNRGEFGRLLMDEWALAAEIPMEFLRRAAENELTFLRRAYRREAPVGRVIAVVDTGPEQLGAGRLLQLAALVVLHRRAAASGAELALRILGEPDLTTGTLSELLRHWLHSRSAATPTSDQIEAAFESTERDGHAWLLSGPTTRALVPNHRRALTSHVDGWRDDGAARIRINIADATAQLALPEPKVAAAALRGEGLFRRRAEPALATVPTTGRGAVFGSADARLLWRGSEEGELYGCFVGGNDPARPKRYRVNGSIVAAASLGRRIVAAVTDGTGLWIQVIGKKLARTDRIHVSLSVLGIDCVDLERIQSEPLRPLYLQGGSIVLRGADRWHSLNAEEVTSFQTVTELAPGSALDSPREAYLYPRELVVGPNRFAVTSMAAGPIFGPTGSDPFAGTWCAWSEDTRTWKVARGRNIVAEIAVDEADKVHGLCVIGNMPALLVVSPSGRIVRQISAKQVRTWTRWAGPAHFNVHPTRPWLARTTDDTITVGDLATGETLLEIRADT